LSLGFFGLTWIRKGVYTFYTWINSFCRLKLLDVFDGLHDDNEQHAMLKQDMISIVTDPCLIVGSSKFGKTTMTHVADLNAFSEMITDNRADAIHIKQLEESGLKVSLVSC